MLCNNPPIPLRVLDFLHTEDLLNLSLVCKATHQAGHVLLQREVRTVTTSLSTVESTHAIVPHHIQNGWHNDFSLNLLGGADFLSRCWLLDRLWAVCKECARHFVLVRKKGPLFPASPVWSAPEEEAS
jgi:hypothetical protein